jgi:hypothetical protein
MHCSKKIFVSSKLVDSKLTQAGTATLGPISPHFHHIGPASSAQAHRTPS